MERRHHGVDTQQSSGVDANTADLEAPRPSSAESIHGSNAKRRAVYAGRKLQSSLVSHARTVHSCFTPAAVKQFVKKEWPYLLMLLLVLLGTTFLQIFAWPTLEGQGWFVVWITMLSVCAMVRNFVDPDVILFGATTIFLLAGIIDQKQAFGGLSNDAIITIALTIGIAVGIENTGALDYMPKLMYGGSCFCAKWKWVGQARMYAIVATISAFINNTPIVAVFIPVVEKYCQQTEQAPSQFMMPLSTAAILGGVCTIIGTSTNLIVQGLLARDFPEVTLGFFEIGKVGGPMAVAGCIYICLFSRFLLPTRGGAVQELSKNARAYAITMVVHKSFVGVGETVDIAGLRGLRRLFLTEITRANGVVVPAPGPNTLVLEGDTLVFTGDVESVPQLLNVTGLKMVGTFDYTDALELPQQRDDGILGGYSRQLVEAVVGLHSPLVGDTIKGSGFRTKYGASVISLYRQGEALKCATDVKLNGGDTLLLEATPDFMAKYRLSTDFALVTYPYEVPKTRRDPIKLILAIGLFVALVILNACEVKQLATLALAVLYLYWLLGIMTIEEFRRSIPGMILLTITGGFGVAQAVDSTGVADQVGNSLINGFNWMGGIGPVFGLYLATELLTALLSNGAAVTIMYPIAKSIVLVQGGDGKSYWYALMLAASSDFMTPIGYQTNLMVMGPGGYRFLDYMKYGFGLQVICITIATLLCYNLF